MLMKQHFFYVADHNCSTAVLCFLQLFQFWMDFFVEATKQETSDVRFPVSVILFYL